MTDKTIKNSHLKSQNMNCDSPNPTALSAILSTLKSPTLMIAKDTKEAYSVFESVKFFNPKLEIALLPDWETLPFDHFSAHEHITSQRLSLLYQCLNHPPELIIASIQSLTHRLAPKHWIKRSCLTLQVGETLSLEHFSQQLFEHAYQRVDTVTTHGEYALRGGIIDIFPMGALHGIRIEFFDDRIDSLRTFDPNNQRTIDQHESIQILPAKEYPLDQPGIEFFRQKFRERFNLNPNNCPLYNHISDGNPSAGAQYYLPLFFEETSTFFDFITPNTALIFSDQIWEAHQQFYKQTQRRYEQYAHDTQRPILTPEEVFIDEKDLKKIFNSWPQTRWNKAFEQQHGIQSNPPLEKDTHICEKLIKTILAHPYKTFLAAPSLSRCDRIKRELVEYKIHAKIHSTWQDAYHDDERIAIISSTIAHGFTHKNNNYVILTESDYHSRPIQVVKSNQTSAKNFFNDLSQLEVGQYIVHRQYGIGQYMGLEIVETSLHQAEYLMLCYEGGDKMYVPVTDLDQINQHTCQDDSAIKLHSLNSKKWLKEKEKSKKHIKDTAAELLEIYSQRHQATGFSFDINSEDFKNFRNAFPFEETKDQKRAINDVLADMQSHHYMDRLICGDVGFGKTEVAMQAACVAALNQKQVAMLVPTTLLCQQHYDNFQNRFHQMPFRIEALSRFQSASERKNILSALQQGQVDIIIATHALLQKTIAFKDLGLLIIDEEHRFGVKHKEQIKSLKAQVDIITLTATPIPRTLNLSLSAFRDISLITTPPQHRLPIKTFVNAYRDGLVQEAIQRELQRGGQVFFLYNDVAKMSAFKEKLEGLIPHTNIALAHGQMPKQKLEQVMNDFYQQRIQILLCSTIIESGIDIDRVNTILIHRADRFGLAQLHQLRGRVGRSNHQGYAYLFTPESGEISSDAKKRLEAIEKLQELGSGFMLANHDLDIRGAGSLLGKEQSGQMTGIGLSLYMDLLDEAVSALKNPDKKPLKETQMDLPISMLFPEKYIQDVGIRLNLYKRLAHLHKHTDIDALRDEIIDRFGPPPPESEALFNNAKVRCIATKVGIKKISVSQRYIRLFLDQSSQINFQKMLQLIQTQQHHYQLEKQEILKCQLLQEHPLIDQIESILHLIV